MLKINKIAQNQSENLNSLLRPIESISINNDTEIFKRILDDSTKEKLDFIRKKFAEVLNNEHRVKLSGKPIQNYENTDTGQSFRQTPLLIMQDTTDLINSKIQLNKNSIYSKQIDSPSENQKFQNRKITTTNDNQEQQRNRNQNFSHHQQQQQQQLSAPLLTVFSNFKPYNHENVSVKTNNSTDISFYTTNPTPNTLATTVLPPILAGKRINLPQTQQRYM
jgi:hypothetical protein